MARKTIQIGARTYRQKGGRIEVLKQSLHGPGGAWHVVVKPSASTLAAFEATKGDVDLSAMTGRNVLSQPVEV
jgi:hypothetical protein